MLIAAAALAGCWGDETVTGYLDGADIFALQSINGTAFAASATIDLSETGRVSGKAPCNSYFAEQSAPYPWFDIGPIAATKAACPDLPAEGQFFDTLSRMTVAEVSGDTLILSNTDDEEMVFQAP